MLAGRVCTNDPTCITHHGPWPGGFAIFSPEGNQIEHFSVDSGFVSNLAIGGPNNDKLMVTAYSKLFIFDIK